MTDDFLEALTARERFAPDDDAVRRSLTSGLKRRRARRRWVAVAAAAVAVLLVGGTTAVLTSGRTAEPSPIVRPVGTTAPTTTAGRTTSMGSPFSKVSTVAPPAIASRAPMTAGSLAVTVPTTGPSAARFTQGRWSTAPTAPIPDRQSAASAWTGSEMLVWGGSGPLGLRADGASYDPVSQKWTALPASGMSARKPATSVWTGTSWFVWGSASGTSQAPATDGAWYTPASGRWTPVPTSPVRRYTQAVALWTGSEVLLLTAEIGSQGGAPVIHLVSLDPKSGSWSDGPDLVLPHGHPVNYFSAVATDRSIVVWSMWSLVTRLSANSDQIGSGVDRFVFDPTSVQWSVGGPIATRQTFDGPVWTGHSVVSSPSGSWCVGCSTPFQILPIGFVFDPGTGQTTAMNKGPLDVSDPTWSWTGSGILAASAVADPLNARPWQLPMLAFWDAATGTWHELPKGPMGFVSTSISASAWTGTQLVLWGDVRSKDGKTTAGGLTFTPAAD